MLATQPTAAETPQTSPVIAVGVDSGAGLTKVCLGIGSSQIKVRTPKESAGNKGRITRYPDLK